MQWFASSYLSVHSGQSVIVQDVEGDHDIDSERRDGFAAIHPYQHLVGIKGDMAANEQENLLTQDCEQIGFAPAVSFVRE
jgi:hypothetical protein